MVNHSILCRSIKYDYMNILTWIILKKTQILNGCKTFAFKYIYLLNVPSFSSRYFNKIKLTSRLGTLLALSLEILIYHLLLYNLAQGVLSRTLCLVKNWRSRHGWSSYLGS